MDNKDRETKAFCGTVLLVVIAVFALVALSSCELLGDPYVDPVSGLVVKSPVATAFDSLSNSGTRLAPGVIADLTDDGSLSGASQTAIGTAAMAALYAGFIAYRRRRAAKAKRRV